MPVAELGEFLLSQPGRESEPVQPVRQCYGVWRRAQQRGLGGDQEVHTACTRVMS